MPTLIRLFVTLLILAGIVFGAMIALTIFVQPEPDEVIVRIPSRELFANENAGAQTQDEAAPAAAADPAPAAPAAEQ